MKRNKRPPAKKQSDNPYLERVLEATRKIKPPLNLGADAIAVRKGKSGDNVENPRGT